MNRVADYHTGLLVLRRGLTLTADEHARSPPTEAIVTGDVRPSRSPPPGRAGDEPDTSEPTLEKERGSMKIVHLTLATLVASMGLALTTAGAATAADSDKASRAGSLTSSPAAPAKLRRGLGADGARRGSGRRELKLRAGCSAPWNCWIDFNQVDQTALIYGTGAGVVAALCYLGPWVCIPAAVIAAVAGTYLVNYGRCPAHRPTLRVRFITYVRVEGCI